jgi:hypothetical protein
LVVHSNSFLPEISRKFPVSAQPKLDIPKFRSQKIPEPEVSVGQKNLCKTNHFGLKTRIFGFQKHEVSVRKTEVLVQKTRAVRKTRSFGWKTRNFGSQTRSFGS